jgi:hypothetical protein
MAPHHSSPQGQLTEADVEQFAAHVVEVQVDPLRARFTQAGRDVPAAVVHRGVETEFFDEPRTFLVRPGHPHDPRRALEPSDLTHDRAGGSGSAGDDHGVALLDLADIEQTEVRRHSRDPEDTQRRRRIDTGRQRLHGSRSFVGERVILPTAHPEHEIPHRVPITVGAHDLGDRSAADDLVDPDRRQLPLDVIHPRAARSGGSLVGRGLDSRHNRSHDRSR